MAKSNVSAAYLDVLLVAGRGGGLVCLQWVAAQVGSADSTSCVCCVCAVGNCSWSHFQHARWPAKGRAGRAAVLRNTNHHSGRDSLRQHQVPC